MANPAFGSFLPYIGDFLIGLLPLVVLFGAIKASIPFRWYALLWYVGVAVGILLLVNENIPSLLANWTGHTTAQAIGFVVGAIWWIRPRRRSFPA